MSFRSGGMKSATSGAMDEARLAALKLRPWAGEKGVYSKLFDAPTSMRLDNNWLYFDVEKLSSDARLETAMSMVIANAVAKRAAGKAGQASITVLDGCWFLLDSPALEHFHLSCSVSGAKKEAFAIGGGNGLEGYFRCAQQLFFGPGSLAAQGLFDFAPQGLDGIEVGRIGREVQQPSADRFEGFPDAWDFVRRPIVQNDYLAGVQGRREPLLHPSPEHFTVQGALKKPRSTGTLQTNAGDQGAGLIVSLRDARSQSCAAQRAAPQPGHLGVGSAFVHEHPTGRGLDRQLLMPTRPSFGDVGTFLFGGGQSFF